MWGWGPGSQILCYYSCLLSTVAFGSTKTPKLGVLLFSNTTETNLFVSDSVETIFGPGFDLSTYMTEFCWTPQSKRKLYAKYIFFIIISPVDFLADEVAF
jgi:hypothetical protein